MLAIWKKSKKKLIKLILPSVVLMIKAIMKLILWTCHIQIEGLDSFRTLAKENKCILMFWHNRTIILPFIISPVTPELIFTGLTKISDSGDLLTVLLHSFPNIKTIRCHQNSSYKSINEIIQTMETGGEVTVITPDGSRGPKYCFKQGSAFIALKTQAHVIPLDWESSRYWELRTWDRLRIPKPFSYIKISFKKSICFNKSPLPSLEEAKEVLKKAL